MEAKSYFPSLLTSPNLALILLKVEFIFSAALKCICRTTAKRSYEVPILVRTRVLETVRQRTWGGWGEVCDPHSQPSNALVWKLD